jgi:hypothetical protein
VINRNARDDGGDRIVHNVCRIEPSAETHLQQQHVGGVSCEQQKTGGGRDFKDGDGCTSIGAFAFFHRGRQFLIRNQRAFAASADPETLVEPDQMRRSVDMNAFACRFEDRAQESDRGAFAVCPGNMDDRWQLLFGMIEGQPAAAARGRAKDRYAWDAAR